MRENTLFHMLGIIRVAFKECMASLRSLLFKSKPLGVFMTQRPYPHEFTAVNSWVVCSWMFKGLTTLVELG